MRISSVILLSFILLSACKKGDEDPWLSLKTRTARLADEWQVVEAEWETNDSIASFADGEYKIYLNNIEYVGVEGSMTFVFLKQGSYTINRTVNYPDNWKGTNSIAFTEDYEETGSWQFTGGAGEVKEKSQLLLLPNKVQTSRFIGSALDVISYSGQNEGRVYDLLKLTDGETKLVYRRERSDDLDTYISAAEITLHPL